MNPVAHNAFTESHLLNVSLSVLLQNLLLGNGKPTTHRLADTCNMLLSREKGREKGVTLTTDLDMIALFVVNLLAKMDFLVISPGLILLLTLTLWKSVYRISKMNEMEREEADEDEEAAGIMSLALLKDGINCKFITPLTSIFISQTNPARQPETDDPLTTKSIVRCLDWKSITSCFSSMKVVIMFSGGLGYHLFIRILYSDTLLNEYTDE
ncbi:hypothetical protein BLNAU_21223 [Blattamonas nauphoetae]|uniref:Uncharacterized protein n=1 Tax=Blattamonas nauphoetae TaxID=2049346 RepID=A0ABQ9WWJ5_9EUKA|nr:hypothetical protein BLNAU_21223 [Blattamonas nauphoetae]